MKLPYPGPVPRRGGAALAALVVAAAGSLVLGGSSPAAAGSASVSYDCVFSTSHSQFTTTATLTAPATAAAGESVDVTLDLNDAGPANGPVPLPANSVAASAQVLVSGQDPITLSAPASHPAIPAKGTIPIPELSGELTVAQPGSVTLTLGQITLDIPSYGLSLSCALQGDAPVLHTMTVTAGGGSGTASVSKISGRPAADTTGARPGDTVTLGGSGWTPSAAVDAVELCSLTGTGCSGADLTPDLTVDSTGKLTGTVLINASATPGPHSLKITQGGTTATLVLGVLGTRSIQLSPSGGGPGTATTVTGASFDPGDEVTVTPVDDTGAATADLAVTAPVDARGSFTATLTPAAGTVKIVAAEKDGVAADSAEAAWAAAANGGSSEQNLKIVVAGGALTMAQEPGEVTFEPVTVDGTDHTSAGTLRSVQVKDFRGGTQGWSLVGTVTDFRTASGAVIPAGQLSWTPTCGVHTGAAAASTVTPGSPGPLSTTTAAPLCTQAASTDPASVTGGHFDAGAGLALDVPAITQSGAYEAVLRLTLS
ncbi:WxL domain-containing protein [Streptomyces sp. NBC_01007]|nr:WxL domain-containing protein [Streptomyces sp. NBC_01007]